MSALSLVPFPARLASSGEAPFALTAGARVDGDAAATSALLALVLARTGIALDADPRDAAITLRVEHAGAPESYRVGIRGSGIEIVGAADAGLFYGIQTLVQLVRADRGGWSIPAVHVEDAPRFAYRGVMLDVARHFFPVDVVMRYIDHAASLKLNALHLHLSDDQGWRLELRSRPELTAKASSTAIGGGQGGYFTREDYEAILTHAASRHMIVVPEFDVPGHTHSVGLAYPELVAEPVLTDTVLQDVAEYGGGVPTNGEPYTGLAVGFSSLRIDSDATYDFLTDVFGELAGLTPGPYLHFGGDEALGTDPADFATFVGRASRIIADLGKTPIAWHEAGVAELAEGTIGQFWGLTSPSEDAAREARGFVAAGSRLILSPADALYLDHKYAADSRLGATWANGPTSVERSYAWEPASILPGLADADILGVEAALWTETVWTDADIHELAFPRMASAAEIAWSPASSPERTWESFRVRVGGLGPLWSALGIRYFASPEIPWSAS